MSQVVSDGADTGAIRYEVRAELLGAADWLSLAAAPTFAIMALLTAVLGGGSPLCAAKGASPLIGMIPMYLLMSAFHSAPWLKLVSGWRSGARLSGAGVLDAGMEKQHHARRDRADRGHDDGRDQ